MQNEYEKTGIERASRRWHTESVGTQVLRALAEAEERDAAIEQRAFRVEVKPVAIQAGVTHTFPVFVPQALELLCLELDPTNLRHLRCVRLQVGSLVVVEGAPLELLNRAWLSRLLVDPQRHTLTLTIENHSQEKQLVQGSIVGLEPKPAQ